MELFYDFFYEENNFLYINVEEDGKTKKYILDDYVENVKKNKLFSGFIKISAISQLKNKVIIILDNMTFKESFLYYHKLTHFNYTDIKIFDLKDIIFINFINGNHYQLMKPKNEFILERMSKTNEILYNYIIYDRINSQIVDIRNEYHNSILDTLNSKDKSIILKKSNEQKILQNSDNKDNDNKSNDIKSNKKNVEDKYLKDKNLINKDLSKKMRKKYLIMTYWKIHFIYLMIKK